MGEGGWLAGVSNSFYYECNFFRGGGRVLGARVSDCFFFFFFGGGGGGGRRRGGRVKGARVIDFFYKKSKSKIFFLGGGGWQGCGEWKGG